MNNSTTSFKKEFKRLMAWQWILSIALLLFHFTEISAQTPQYSYTAALGGNSIPLGGGTWADQRGQFLYPPGDFGNVPAGMAIEKIYFRASGTYPLSTYNNFRVSIGQNSTTTALTNNWETGLTQALQASSFSLGPTILNQWLEIPLDNPIPYNPNEVLIVETYQTGTTGGIALLAGGQPLNNNYTGATQNYGSSSALTAAASRIYSYQFGFDLISLSPNDAGVKSIDKPDVFCSGIQDVYATISNYGLNQLTQVNIHWEIDNVPMGTINYIGLLDTINGNLPQDTTIRLGSFDFSDPNGNEIKVYTSLPNNVNDSVNGNDTLTKRVGPALTGYYTINNTQPTGRSNYNSIREFTEAIHQVGVCGPVITEIVSNTGPYNEFIEIKSIPGASATNTIHIIGNGNTVQYQNNVNDRQLLILDGASYVTIDNISFKALDVNYGWAALITGNARHDTIINCDFDLTGVASISSANTNGICFSGSRTTPTTLGGNGSHCYIANNHIKSTSGNGGPYYALTIIGESDSNYIVNNQFENFYFYGMYMNGSTGNNVIGNEFHRANKTTTTTFYGIYTTGITPGTKIMSNKIHSPGGVNGGTGTTYGIYLLGDGEASLPVIVANNAIYNMNQGGILYGITASTAPFTKIYHNSIVFDKVLSGSSSNYGIYTIGSHFGVEIKNNIVSITEGSMGDKYGFYYSSAIDDAQKNNIYVNSNRGGNQGYGFYSAAYATMASFKAANPSLETNSPSINPRFVDANLGNLLPQHPSLVGAGENLLSVVGVDINGDPRLPTPTIGAYEGMPTAMNDASLMSFASPSGRYCEGLQDVKVVVSNAGINNIDSVEIYWRVDGMMQTPYKYIGLLTPMTNLNGQNHDTVNIGQITVYSNLGVNVEAWVEMPNGLADTVNINDSISDIFMSSSFGIQAALDTICIGAEPRLYLTPNNGYVDGAISWQRSSNGTTWLDLIDSDVTTLIDTGVVNSSYYRANIDGVNGCYTDSVYIQIDDPELLSTTPGLNQCAGGRIELSASGIGGVVCWYDSINSGTPIFVGDTFLTPHLTQTKTYYASSTSIGTPAATTIDSLYVTVPPTAYYGATDLMFTVHAKTEISITSMGIYCFNDVGDPTDWDIYWRPDDYTLIPGANTSSNGWTLVSSIRGSRAFGLGGYTTIAKSMGVVIPANTTASFYIAPLIGTIPIFLLDNTGTRVDSTQDAVIIAGNSGNGLFNANGSYGVPLMSIRYGFACESPRVAVDAVVNSNFAATVNLGGNKTVCSDSILTLDAGNPGSIYTWNTGDTTQTIQVDSAGKYKVKVTNNNNCTTEDSVIITHSYASKIDSIDWLVGMEDEYIFVPIGASRVENYFWNFGDNNTSTSPSPLHKYANPGIYTVTLVVSNNCGSDTATLVLEHQTTGIENNPSMNKKIELYPNPAKNFTRIQSLDKQAITSIRVYNNLGQNVYEKEVGDATYYQLNVNHFYAGIYTLRIQFKEGDVVGSKLEIIK